MSKRKWTAEEKFGIVIQGIKGEVSIAQLCRDHCISQVQYYKWRDLFYKAAKDGLSGKNKQNGSADKEKIRKLERIIGCQTVAIEELKKNLTWE